MNALAWNNICNQAKMKSITMVLYLTISLFTISNCAYSAGEYTSKHQRKSKTRNPTTYKPKRAGLLTATKQQSLKEPRRTVEQTRDMEVAAAHTEHAKQRIQKRQDGQHLETHAA